MSDLTRVEVIEILQNMLAWMKAANSIVSKYDRIKALEYAIDRLETDEAYQLMKEQPELCEDCISREYVEEMIDRCYAASWNDNDFYDRLMAELEVTPSVLPKAKWIPVSERLPEESYNSVLGWDAYRERCVLVQYLDGRFQIAGKTESFDIRAWMPLPKAYSEVKE